MCWMSGNMGGGEYKMSQFSYPIDSKQTLVFKKNLQTDKVLVWDDFPPPPVRFYPTPMRGVGVNNSKREGEYSYDPNSILS